MTDDITADIAIIGAGIAGAGLAADLAGDFSVVLIEQEERPGFHSTGRSAAIFIQNYGNAPIRALNRFSAGWYASADRKLFPNPLLTPRGCLFVADEEGLKHHRKMMAEDEGLQELSAEQAVALVPVLKREAIIVASYEKDSKDIDVAALHQGWLKQAKAHGSTAPPSALTTMR